MVKIGPKRAEKCFDVRENLLRPHTHTFQIYTYISNLSVTDFE